MEQKNEAKASRFEQRMEKISAVFVPLWLIWIVLTVIVGGWRDGLGAGFKGLLIYAVIAFVVWASEKTGGGRPDVPPSEWGRR